MADRPLGRARHAASRRASVWFRFEVFREWIDHALNELLRRKWEAPINGVGIPATYALLDAG